MFACMYKSVTARRVKRSCLTDVVSVGNIYSSTARRLQLITSMLQLNPF